MKNIGLLFGALALALAGAPACSSSTTVTTSGDGGTAGTPNGGPVVVSSAAVNQFCTTTCDRLHTCDTRKDKFTCVQECANTGTTAVTRWRPEMTASVSNCLGVKDCRQVLSGLAYSQCSD